jgi:hypothetical protein
MTINHIVSIDHGSYIEFSNTFIHVQQMYTWSTSQLEAIESKDIAALEAAILEAQQADLDATAIWLSVKRRCLLMVSDRLDVFGWILEDF